MQITIYKMNVFANMSNITFKILQRLRYYEDSENLVNTSISQKNQQSTVRRSKC